MRTSLIKNGTCDCNHSKNLHEVEEEFHVACKANGCDCQEYNEPIKSAYEEGD